jgi:hypothetical protein
LKPSVTYLWPSIAAGVDLQAPPGVNDELARSVREVVARTRVPGFEQMHFASTHNDHVELLREHASEAAVEWWLGAVSSMFFATIEQAFHARLDCKLEMTGHVMVARDGDRVPAHRHSSHDLTILYYPHVDMPERNDRLNTGALVMTDDRGVRHIWRNRNPAFHDQLAFRIHPRTGLMVAFTAHTLHETDVYRGPGERIVMAINARANMERQYQ